MHYFSNFETNFFKLIATVLIATDRRATVGQLHFWPQSAVSQIIMSVPLNISDKAPKIIALKFQILSLFLTILCYFEFFLALL